MLVWTFLLSVANIAYLSDIRNRRSLLSQLCWHHDTAVDADSSGNCAFPVAAAQAWNSLSPETRACFSLLTVSPFSSVIWLTLRCPLRWSADVCIELCNSFRSRFCTVPPQLCDGSTIILTFSVVVAIARLAKQFNSAGRHERLEHWWANQASDNTLMAAEAYCVGHSGHTDLCDRKWSPEQLKILTENSI